MSEFSSFRINPQLSAVDNCKENVRNNADVFVLVIGGKRGSVVEPEGKSIVNLEYEAAVRQGLDVFVFVDQAVLTLLPIWKSNRSAVLSPAVDSNQVLAFVERVRDEQRWTFPFTKEADIIEVLSLQLSGQLRELLQKRRSGHLDLLETFKNETPTAISLVQTRAPFWEHLLTAELLETRLVSSRKRFADIQAGRALGPHQRLTGKAFLAWVGGKFDEAKCAVEKIKFVIENEMSASWVLWAFRVTRLK
jgi:hypothetical protein